MNPLKNKGKGKLIPFQQGALDAFCGIYSLVNAEQLINNSDEKKSQELFNNVIFYLEKKKRLAEILTEGMLLKDLKLLLQNVIGTRIPKTELRFQGVPNPSLEVFWQEVQQFLSSESHRAVILSLSGIHEHWTTINRITDKQIKLFDSDGLKILNRGNCTTADATSQRHHEIWPAQSLFLSGKS